MTPYELHLQLHAKTTVEQVKGWSTVNLLLFVLVQQVLTKRGNNAVVVRLFHGKRM